MLAFHFFRQAGFVRDFRLNEVKLCAWLQKIEAGYDSNNPYHNRYTIPLFSPSPPFPLAPTPAI